MKAQRIFTGLVVAGIAMADLAVVGGPYGRLGGRLDGDGREVLAVPSCGPHGVHYWSRRHARSAKYRETMTAPRRRWLSFSLRTLFVVVTVFACGLSWLALEARTVNRRARMVIWCEDHGAIVEPLPEGGPPTDNPFSGCFTGDYMPHISWLRKQLGDIPVIAIDFFLTAPAQDIQRDLDDLFPEADLAWSEVDGTTHRFGRRARSEDSPATQAAPPRRPAGERAALAAAAGSAVPQVG